MPPSSRRARLAVGLLPGAAILTALALIPFIGRPHLGDPFLTFAAFVLVTELLDTAHPSGRRLALSLAPGLAFAMVETMDSAASTTAIVGLTYFGSCGLAALIRVAAGREVRIRATATMFLTVTAAAAAYDALAASGPVHLRSTEGVHLASAAGMFALLAIALIAEPLAAFATSLVAGDKGATRAAVHAFRSGAPLQLAIVSVASLAALAFPRLGGWSFPLFLGPLAATRYAFKQITQIRRTEVQTLRALSKIPEMAGYTHPGHSRRVAELSLAIAAELGASEDELRDIEYAALLHDIGRVVLEDPDTSKADSVLRRDIAETGANIVAAAGTFPRVALLIREQHEPHRRRGETTNSEVPLGSRILKVANTYDDLLRPDSPVMSPWDVLEHLHARQAHDYDPEVVAALARTLAKSGEI